MNSRPRTSPTSIRTNSKSNDAYLHLEKRTFQFAKSVRLFARKLDLSISNIEDAERLLRSSGSVGASTIEARIASNKKDFISLVRTCRKNAKESAYWLKLLGAVNNNGTKAESTRLYRESLQLTQIFSSLLEESRNASWYGHPLDNHRRTTKRSQNNNEGPHNKEQYGA